MNKDILDKCDVVLDANDQDFAEQFREAIGAKPGETIEIMTPQFTRTDGVVPVAALDDFSALSKLSKETLKAIGCCPWDEPNDKGEVLWLLPGEWYDRIPEGFPLTCIDGKTEPFKRGETDDDTRYGCLAYGIMVIHGPGSKADPEMPSDGYSQR
jgi:hypothetical protein